MQARRPFLGCPLSVCFAVTCAAIIGASHAVLARTQWAGATINETALAMPQMGPRKLGPHPETTPLPRPLPPSDIVRIGHILALQATGSITEAAQETERLENTPVLGFLLAERYLNGTYRSSAAELTGWLGLFGDQPDAAAVRGLLRRLDPRLAATHARPAHGAVPSPSAQHGVAMGDSRFRSLFARNRDREVLALAEPSPGHPPTGDTLLVAGLAAWRLDRMADAVRYLEAAHASATAANDRAGAAFWLSRGAARQNDPSLQKAWLRRAVAEVPTFYGHLARRMLGAFHGCLALDTLGGADTDALLDAPGGRRAFALLQIGETARAEAELRALWFAARPDPGVARAVFLVARTAALWPLAGEILSDESPSAIPRGTIPRLRPAGGFVIDPALIYAVVRRESNFQPEAVSAAGARGLMQVMPATAEGTGLPGAGQINRLHDPATNLAIGQRYLLQLDGDEMIDGDLIRLLAAYSQGPNAVRRWIDDVRDDGDPLMFMEAIPNATVRQYVQETLMHSWRYAAAFNLPTPSLDQLVSGRFPRLLKLERAAAAPPVACRS